MSAKPDLPDWLAGLPSPTLLAANQPPVDYEAEKKQRQASFRRETLEAFEASMPAAYRACRIGTPELDRRVVGPGCPRKALEAIEATSGWIVLVGPPAAGKTSLAAALLRHRLESDLDARGERGIDLPRFHHAYRLGFVRIQTPAGQGEAPDVWDAMHAPLVVLDDVGFERNTQNNAVPDVIFERHAECRKTIITTGFSPDELSERYGGGISRRIFEGSTVIKLGSKR